MSVPRGARVVVRRTGDPDPQPLLVETVRHPGESVHTAAARALRQAGLDDADPWAVDLSGTVALLAADVPAGTRVDRLRRSRADGVTRSLAVPMVRVGVRPMAESDLPDVVRWTSSPHVARWWDGRSVDLDTARRRYGPRLGGQEPTRMWVLELDGGPAGFVQDYRIGDHPDYALLTARPDAVGVDYLLGEPGWVGRGVGTRVLWHYLRDVVRPHYPDATTVFAAPDHRNAASLRVLDKLGFERGLWFDEPKADGSVSTVVGCCLSVSRMFGRWRVTRG